MSFLPTFYTIQVMGAPLPEAFLSALQKIEIETSTERAAVFRLSFALSRTALGDWDVLQFDIFQPLVPVKIGVFLGSRPETIVNGFVNEARLDNRTEPGKSTLEVVGMDATATVMNLQELSLPWPNMADSTIAAVIFAKYGMVPSTWPTAASRTNLDVTTAQRGTDIRFLRQMARRNAFECYVQPDPILGTDVGHFHPPQLLLPHQAVLSTDFGLATNMETFHVTYGMLEPTSALTQAFDPRTRVPVPGIGAAALEPPLGLVPALARILMRPVVRPAGTDAANAAEAMALAQSVANRSSRCIQGSGEVDGLKLGRVVRPGLPVAVRGAGREHSGLYYVTQVSHSLAQDRYTQRIQAWRNALGLTGAELFLDPLAAVS